MFAAGVKILFLASCRRTARNCRYVVCDIKNFSGPRIFIQKVRRRAGKLGKLRANSWKQDKDSDAGKIQTLLFFHCSGTVLQVLYWTYRAGTVRTVHIVAYLPTVRSDRRAPEFLHVIVVEFSTTCLQYYVRTYTSVATSFQNYRISAFTALLLFQIW